jgi:AcrR family transcriptional regulator
MSPRTKAQNEAIREQARKQIIEAAFELFANEGYGKTSIAAVAQKAAVSKGLIYHYFGSKQEILEAILEQLVALGEEMTSFPDNFTAQDKIRQILEQTFIFIQHKSGIGKLMVSLALQRDAFETLKPKLDTIQKEQMKMFSGIMEELGFEQPMLEAYELGATLDGILLAWVSMGSDYPLEEMKQKLLDEYALR